MAELRKMYKKAFDYVSRENPAKWSSVHCPRKRYKFMKANNVECLSSCLKFAHQLPITTLVEFIRNMLQKMVLQSPQSCGVNAITTY
ncbi:hypothetical protein ACOSQ2_014373 [Xanthoceras sorbifolium]